jgi:hypothetical protein
MINESLVSHTKNETQAIAWVSTLIGYTKH